MSDRRQMHHFQIKENRYEENLIMHPPKHTQEETNVITQLLHARNSKRVVELGSGNGRLTIPLLQKNIQVWAVDISTDSLESLKKTVSHMNIARNHLTTSQTIPQGVYDAVVGCDILHHLDLDLYLPQMRDKLTSKGSIIFSEPNIFNISWSILITFMIDWRIEWRIIFCNYFTLLHKLRKNNFTHINIMGFGLIPPPLLNCCPLLQKINYYLGDLFFFKLFAYRYIIVAEKD